VSSTAPAESAVVMRARIDTAVEADWYRHGGVLNFVLLELLAAT
jgi:aconitase A